MDKSAGSTSALLRFAIILVGASGLVAAETENTLAWDRADSWQSDGMWSVTSLQKGLQFLKDKKPAHNSMCWLPLERPLRRGQSMEITYRMEVPYKHVDMFVGRSCAQTVYGEPMSDFAEVVSLGGIPQNTLVTIHNKTQAFEIIGKVADVRIAFRDIYPFFSNPKHGPTTFEASMNYYEDEIDKCRRLLPGGASLWVMPQGQGEYGYIRTPTPAEVKLQAWSAIAHGAKGLAYFIYHSAGEPGKLRFDGLRALDGSPTDRLETLTELARQLVPLGPTIVRWDKSSTPAETDHRSLRAYLFAGEHQEAYAVVYNRNVKEAAAASVRVPLQLGEHVLNLVNPGKVLVQESDGRSVFAVRLKPGEGGIFSLGVKLP